MPLHPKDTATNANAFAHSFAPTHKQHKQKKVRVQATAQVHRRQVSHLRGESKAADNTHKVFQFPYTIEEQKEQIDLLLLVKPRLNFEDLFEHCQNRLHGVFLFLALLEMIQVATVMIYTGAGLNNFWITKPETPAFYAN